MADLIGLTGGNGFLGSHLKRELGLRGFNVKEFDRDKYDLLHYDSLADFVKDCKVIVHLAGINRGDELDFVRVNAEGSFNLARVIRDFNKECRLIFASSAQVYSPNDGEAYSEEDFASPQSLYGISKKFGEMLIDYCHIKSTILRFTNIYGEGCRPFYNSAIATFVELAKKGERIEISCSPEKRMDLLYVKDAVEAILLAINKDINGIFNIATGNAISMKEVLDELKRYFPKMAIDKKGDDESTILMKNEKTFDVLGFRPRFDFKEGLKKYIEAELNEHKKD